MQQLWFIADAPIYGGAERFVLRLSRFVNDSVPGRSARIVCPLGTELARRAAAGSIAVEHATFPDLGLFHAPAIAGAVVRLRRVIRDAGPDAVLVGASLRTHVYVHAALIGLQERPRVVHLMPEQESARRLTTRLVIRDAVVAVGENTARAYRQRLPGVRVWAVNNFLLPQELEAAARLPAPDRCQRAPRLGVLARLIPDKGVLELVDELAASPESWASLVVAGQRQDEIYARQLEARIESLALASRVRLLDPVDELGPFFASIDALVVPSTGTEGQPGVVSEALAHGRPVVVRHGLWSEDYAGLPVDSYIGAADLSGSLERVRDLEVDRGAVERAFGPTSVLEALDAAACGHQCEGRRKTASR